MMPRILSQISVIHDISKPSPLPPTVHITISLLPSHSLLFASFHFPTHHFCFSLLFSYSLSFASIISSFLALSLPTLSSLLAISFSFFFLHSLISVYTIQYTLLYSIQYMYSVYCSGVWNFF